jgi:hypothetical protein
MSEQIYLIPIDYDQSWHLLYLYHKYSYRVPSLNDHDQLYTKSPRLHYLRLV